MGPMSPPPGGAPLPPDMPNLSAFPGAQGGPQNPMTAAPKGAAVPRIIFEIEKTLDVLASAIPDASETIDKIKSLLQDVMDSKVQSQSQSLQEEPKQGSGPVAPVGGTRY